jgi:hypothetical protein
MSEDNVIPATAAGGQDTDVIDGNSISSHDPSGMAQPPKEGSVDTGSTLGSNNKITAKMSNGQRKRLKRAQKAFQKQVDDYYEFSRQKQVEETKKFKLLKYQVGKNIYNNLKKASMLTLPERKDENGQILEKSRVVLDANKFLRELHFAIVVLREDRILKGKRKRTTGRASNRAYHSSVIRAIKERTEHLIKTEPIVDINTVPETQPTNE